MLPCEAHYFWDAAKQASAAQVVLSRRPGPARGHVSGSRLTLLGRSVQLRHVTCVPFLRPMHLCIDLSLVQLHPAFCALVHRWWGLFFFAAPLTDEAAAVRPSMSSVPVITAGSLSCILSPWTSRVGGSVSIPAKEASTACQIAPAGPGRQLLWTFEETLVALARVCLYAINRERL